MATKTQNQIGVTQIQGALTTYSDYLTAPFSFTSLVSTLDQAVVGLNLTLPAGTYFITMSLSLYIDLGVGNTTVYGLEGSLYNVNTELTQFRCLAASRRDPNNQTWLRNMGGCAVSSGIITFGSTANLQPAANMTNTNAVSSFKCSYGQITAIKLS